MWLKTDIDRATESFQFSHVVTWISLFVPRQCNITAREKNGHNRSLTCLNRFYRFAHKLSSMKQKKSSSFCGCYVFAVYIIQYIHFCCVSKFQNRSSAYKTLKCPHDQLSQHSLLFFFHRSLFFCLCAGAEFCVCLLQSTLSLYFINADE